MAKKLTQKQYAALRAEYLAKREELLIKKVDGLSVKLFDKIYDGYLVALENSNGKILSTDQNYNIVKGLDEIYKSFRQNDNIPVIKSFISDVQAIVPLNEKYFKNIAKKDIRATSETIQESINKNLGLEPNGQPKKNGFADKFIRDESVLKAIKKLTNKALTQGKSFNDLRMDLKTLIKGDSKLAGSGKLQQYYRKYAYDTFTKVDRISSDLFAKDIGLNFFIWSGGVIKTTRPICRLCNNKIVDVRELRTLSYSVVRSDLVLNNGKMVPFNSGLDEDWDPVNDLGQHNCRHIKDYIPDEIALRNPTRLLDINMLT